MTEDWKIMRNAANSRHFTCFYTWSIYTVWRIHIQTYTTEWFHTAQYSECSTL